MFLLLPKMVLHLLLACQLGMDLLETVLAAAVAAEQATILSRIPTIR